MNNNCTEIVWLLNLLLLNDKRAPIYKEEFFLNHNKPNATLNEKFKEKFLEKATGYISYLRGSNPISFPIRLDPDANNLETKTRNVIKNITRDKYTEKPIYYQKMYKPSPKTNYKGEKLTGLHNNSYQKLMYEPMSIWQYKYYLKSLKMNKKQALLAGKQSSVIIFPSLNNDNKGFPIGFASNIGFNKALIAKTEKVSESIGNITKYKYNLHPNCVGFLHIDRIKQYSIKFYTALKNIVNSIGIIFVYCEWKKAAAIPFAIMLEQNGYTRYVHKDYPKSRNLFSYDNLEKDYQKYIPIKRCYCGILETEHKKQSHTFKQGTYIYIDGETPKPELAVIIDKLKSKENLRGEEIKIIIATGVIKEGLSLFRVREIHLITHWYHMNRLEQVIGRGTRHCSHWLVNKEERNITIFYHCATVPNYVIPSRNIYNLRDPRLKKYHKYSLMDIMNSGILIPKRGGTKRERTVNLLERETIDEKIYRMAMTKARQIANIERILKERAIDCQLNKNINSFEKKDESIILETSQNERIEYIVYDRENSKECNYNKCEYTCYLDDLDPKIDKSTYNIDFAKDMIDVVKTYIRSLYQIEYQYSLEDIIKIVKNTPQYFERVLSKDTLNKMDLKNPRTIDENHIYRALNYFIKNKVVLFDRFNRSGYLIHKKKYYIFQPYELDDENITVRYRKLPLQKKVSKVEHIEKEFEQIKENIIEDKITKSVVSLSKDPNFSIIEQRLELWFDKGEDSLK